MKLEPPLLSFKKIEPPMSRPDLHDDDINRLFLYGEVDRVLVHYSMLDSKQYSYYVKRDMLKATFSEIVNGRKHILVHSDAGNGKTLFLDGLCQELLLDGYSIYFFNKYTSRLNDEIERLCNIRDKKVVLVLEDYSSYFDIIDAFKLYCTDQTIILSERSVRNDMKYATLSSKLGDDFYTVDLNYLNDYEIEVLSDIFDHYGLWQNFSTLRMDKKISYFHDKCGNSMRGILLALFRSPLIKEKLSKIVNSIKEKTNYYEAVVVALLNKVFSLNLSIEMLSDALGGGYIGDYTFRKNSLVNDFIDFDNQEIRVKSSILAEVLLWDVLDVLSIKNVLVEMFKNFDKKKGLSQYYRALHQLLSYTSLQRVLNKNDNNIHIAMRGFFEDIRDTDFCRKNPHYWLQYAIFRLDEHDYNVAKIYFENAFAYAKAKENFDAYQIKNHYARYLLENAVNVQVDNYMDVFNEAHAIVVDPVHLKDNKYYPFKVACNYLPFFEQYKTRMNGREKSIVKNACLRVLQMIENFYRANPRYKGRKDVKEARNCLTQIVNQIG